MNPTTYREVDSDNVRLRFFQTIRNTTPNERAQVSEEFKAIVVRSRERNVKLMEYHDLHAALFLCGLVVAAARDANDALYAFIRPETQEIENAIVERKQSYIALTQESRAVLKNNYMAYFARNYYTAEQQTTLMSNWTDTVDIGNPEEIGSQAHFIRHRFRTDDPEWSACETIRSRWIAIIEKSEQKNVSATAVYGIVNVVNYLFPILAHPSPNENQWLCNRLLAYANRFCLTWEYLSLTNPDKSMILTRMEYLLHTVCALDEQTATQFRDFWVAQTTRFQGLPTPVVWFTLAKRTNTPEVPRTAAHYAQALTFFTRHRRPWETLHTHCSDGEILMMKAKFEGANPEFRGIFVPLFNEVRHALGRTREMQLGRRCA